MPSSCRLFLHRRLLRPVWLAVALLLPSLGPAAAAAPAELATPLSTTAAGRARLDGLQELQQQLDQSRALARQLADASRRLGHDWTSLRQQQRQLDPLQQQTRACIEPLYQALQASRRAVDQLWQQQRQQHALLRQADSPRARAALRDAAAGQQAAEQAVPAALQALAQQQSRCATLESQLDQQRRSSQAALAQFRQQVQQVQRQRGQLQDELERDRLGWQAAQTQGWLDLPAPASVRLLEDTTLPALARQFAALPAPVLAESSDLADRLDHPPETGPQIELLVRLQDAGLFLELARRPSAQACQGRDCPDRRAEQQALQQRIASVSARLSLDQQQLERQLEALEGRLNAAAPALQQQAAGLDAIEPLIEPAVAQAQASAAQAGTLLDAALQQTRQRLAELGESNGGRDNDGPRQGAGWAGAAPPPAPAPAMPRLRSHAYEPISRLGGESAGFGAYTYLLLRSEADLRRPEVRHRYEQVLQSLGWVAPASMVAADSRGAVNLICIPSTSPAGTAPAQLGYDATLGYQLLLRAQNGLLARPELLRRLSSSPGPFLLSLPGRVSEVAPGAPLLLADLGGQPDEAIADLVRNYLGGLLDAFPQQQALWRPPVLQRVALLMLRLAGDTGSLISSTIPAAQAQPGR